MPGPDDEFADATHATRDAREADGICAEVIAADARWTNAEALDLDGVQWRPSLVVPEENWVLHVHLSEGMPSYIARRLQAAFDAGYRIHVALVLDALYDPEVLDLLSSVDAYTFVLNAKDGQDRRRHFLAAIADLDVAVDPAVRVRIAQEAWARRTEGTPHERGRRLEALLAFLLSQVSDFRIFSRNFRNETQEIDIVVQVIKHSTRGWVASGVPYILVESKNTAERIGAPVVTLLAGKLRNKRGRARLGFLFSAAGFTSDAHKEELRLSESELCVVMFATSSIEVLIKAEDLDEQLEDLVGKAILR